MTAAEPNPKPPPKFRPIRVPLISLVLWLIIPGTRQGAIAVLEYIGWLIVGIALLLLFLVIVLKPER